MCQELFHALGGKGGPFPHDTDFPIEDTEFKQVNLY